MTTGWKIVRTLVVAAASVAFAGLSSGDAAARTVDEFRAFHLDEIARVDVHTASVDVHVLPAESSRAGGNEIGVHFHGTFTGIPNPPELVTSLEDGRLVLRIEESWRWGSRSELRLDISAPADFTGDLFIHTASGDVRLDRLELDRVSVETASGDLQADRVSARIFRVHTASGDASLQGFAGHLEFHSASGDLAADSRQLRDQIRIESVSGDVRLAFPADAGFDLSTETVSGDLASEFPITIERSVSGRSVKGTVGGGGVAVAVETVSGDIRLVVRP